MTEAMRITLTVMIVGIGILLVGSMTGVVNAFQWESSKAVNRFATWVSLTGAAIVAAAFLCAMLLHIWR